MEWKLRRKGHLHFPQLTLYLGVYLLNYNCMNYCSTALASVVTTDYDYKSPLGKRFLAVKSEPNGNSNLVEIKDSNKSEFNVLYNPNLDMTKDEFTKQSNIFHRQHLTDNRTGKLNVNNSSKIENSVENNQLRARRSSRCRHMFKNFNRKRQKRCVKALNNVALKPLKATRLKQQNKCNDSNDALCRHNVGILIAKLLKMKDRCNCSSNIIDLLNGLKDIEQSTNQDKENDINDKNKYGDSEDYVGTNVDHETGMDLQLKNYNPNNETTIEKSSELEVEDSSDIISEEGKHTIEAPEITIDISRKHATALSKQTEHTTLEAAVSDDLESVITDSSKSILSENENEKFGLMNLQTIRLKLLPEYKDTRSTEPLPKTQLSDQIKLINKEFGEIVRSTEALDHSRKYENGYQQTSNKKDNEYDVDFISDDDLDYNTELFTENKLKKTDISDKTDSKYIMNNYNEEYSNYNDENLNWVIDKLTKNHTDKYELINLVSETQPPTIYVQYNKAGYEAHNSGAVTEEMNADTIKDHITTTVKSNDERVACRKYFAKNNELNHTGATLSPFESMLCADEGQPKVTSMASTNENVDEIKYLTGDVQSIEKPSSLDYLTSDSTEKDLTMNKLQLASSLKDSLTHNTDTTSKLYETSTQHYKHTSNAYITMLMRNEFQQNTSTEHSFSDEQIQLNHNKNTAATEKEVTMSTVHDTPTQNILQIEIDQSNRILPDIIALSDNTERTPEQMLNNFDDNKMKEMVQDSIFKDENKVPEPNTVSIGTLEVTPDTVLSKPPEKETVEKTDGLNNELRSYNYPTNETNVPQEMKLEIPVNYQRKNIVENKTSSNTDKNLELNDHPSASLEEISTENKVHAKQPQEIVKNNNISNINSILSDVTLSDNVEQKQSRNYNKPKEMDDQNSNVKNGKQSDVNQVTELTTAISIKLNVTPDNMDDKPTEEQTVENESSYDNETNGTIRLTYRANVTTAPLEIKFKMGLSNLTKEVQDGTNIDLTTEPNYHTLAGLEDTTSTPTSTVVVHNTISELSNDTLTDAEKSLTQNTNNKYDDETEEKVDQDSIFKDDNPLKDVVINESGNIIEQNSKPYQHGTAATTENIKKSRTDEIPSSQDILKIIDTTQAYRQLTSDTNDVKNNKTKEMDDQVSTFRKFEIVNADKNLEPTISSALPALTPDTISSTPSEEHFGENVVADGNKTANVKMSSHLINVPLILQIKTKNETLSRDTVVQNDSNVDLNIKQNQDVASPEEMKINRLIGDAEGRKKITNDGSDNTTKETDNQDLIFKKDEITDVYKHLESSTVSSTLLEEQSGQNVVDNDTKINSAIKAKNLINITNVPLVLQIEIVNDTLSKDGVQNVGGSNINIEPDKYTTPSSIGISVSSIFGTLLQDSTRLPLTHVTNNEKEKNMEYNDKNHNKTGEINDEDSIFTNGKSNHVHKVLESGTTSSVPRELETGTINLIRSEKNDSQNSFGIDDVQTSKALNVVAEIGKEETKVITGTEPLHLDANDVIEKTAPANNAQNESTNIEKSIDVYQVTESINNVPQGLGINVVNSMPSQEITATNDSIDLVDVGHRFLKPTTDVNSIESLALQDNITSNGTNFENIHENNTVFEQQDSINVSNTPAEVVTDVTMSKRFQEETVEQVTVRNNNEINNAYRIMLKLNITKFLEGLDTQGESHTSPQMLPLTLPIDAHENEEKILDVINSVGSHVSTTEPLNQHGSGTEDITPEDTSITYGFDRDSKGIHQIAEPVNINITNVNLDHKKMSGNMEPLEKRVHNVENIGENNDAYMKQVIEPIKVSNVLLTQPLERNSTLNTIVNDEHKVSEPIHVSDAHLGLMSNTDNSVQSQDISQNDVINYVYNSVTVPNTPSVGIIKPSASTISNIPTDNVVEDSFDNRVGTTVVHRVIEPKQEDHLSSNNEAVNHITTVQSDYNIDIPALIDQSENTRDQNRVNLLTPLMSNVENTVEYPETHKTDKKLHYDTPTTLKNLQQNFFEKIGENGDSVNSKDTSMIPKLIPVGMVSDISDSTGNQDGLLAMLQFPVVLKFTNMNLINSPDSKFYIENNGKKIEIDLIKSDGISAGSKDSSSKSGNKFSSDTLTNDIGKRSLNEYKSINELPKRFNMESTTIPSEIHERNNNLRTIYNGYSYNGENSLPNTLLNFNSTTDNKQFNNTPHLYDNHKYLKNIIIKPKEVHEQNNLHDSYKIYNEANDDTTIIDQEPYITNRYRENSDEELNVRSKFNPVPFRQSKISPRNNFAASNRINNEANDDTTIIDQEPYITKRYRENSDEELNVRSKFNPVPFRQSKISPRNNIAASNRINNEANDDTTVIDQEPYITKRYRENSDEELNVRSKFNPVPFRQSKISPRNNIAASNRINNEANYEKFTQNENIFDVLYTTFERMMKLINE